MQVYGLGYALASSLGDASRLRDWMLDLAEAMGMTIVNGPTIHSFREPGQPAAGLSGFCIIAESHIAIHTWPESRWFYLHIGSCVGFDAAAAKVLTDHCLGVTEWKAWRLDPTPIEPPP